MREVAGQRRNQVLQLGRARSTTGGLVICVLSVVVVVWRGVWAYSRVP
jgi:hypothetical protein